MSEQTEPAQTSRLRRVVTIFLWWVLMSAQSTIVGMTAGLIVMLIARPLLLGLSDYNPLRRPAVQVGLGVALGENAVTAVELLPFIVVAMTVAGVAAGLVQMGVQTLAGNFEGEPWWVLALSVGWGSGTVVSMLFGTINAVSIDARSWTDAEADRTVVRWIVSIAAIAAALLIGLVVWLSQGWILSGRVQKAQWRLFANTVSYYPTYLPVILLGGLLSL